MATLIMDEDNQLVCDCGVAGFEVTLNDPFDAAEIVTLTCVSCGEEYGVAAQRAARAAAKANR